jgi:hypothetical protein
MHDEPARPDQRIGSRQDGENPNRRSDYLEERGSPGAHGGSGDPAWKPGSAVGENEDNPAARPDPSEQKQSM